jgi:hypothetical protein
MTQVRLKLVLGKFRVTKVDKTPLGYKFAIHFPGLGHMICEIPGPADVREDDVLTLYTEILGAPPTAID